MYRLLYRRVVTLLYRRYLLKRRYRFSIAAQLEKRPYHCEIH